MGPIYASTYAVFPFPKKTKKFYSRTHCLPLVSVLCSGHSGMHLLFCTSRATLQALHPSDKSGLTGPSAEDLQPAEEKYPKRFSLLYLEEFYSVY